jgi:hypothetical protein
LERDSYNKEGGRFLKKAAQNFFETGPMAVKPARPSLKKFFASF